MNQVTPPAMGRSGLRGRWAAAPTARRYLAIETLERRCPLDASGLLGGVDADELADYVLRIDPPSDSPAGYQAGATDPPVPTERAAGEEAPQDTPGFDLPENGSGNFQGGPEEGAPLQGEDPSAGKAEPGDFAGDGAEGPISTGESPEGGSEPPEPDAPRDADSGRPGDTFAPPLAPIGSISLHSFDGLRGGPGSPGLRAARPAPLGAATSEAVKTNSPYQRSELSLTKTRYYDEAEQDALDAEGLLIEAALPLRSLARHGMPAAAGIQIDPGDCDPAAAPMARYPVAVGAAAAAERALVRNPSRPGDADRHASALQHDVALVALLDAQPEGLSVTAVSLPEHLPGQWSAASGAMRVHSHQDLLRVSVQGHSGQLAGHPTGSEESEPEGEGDRSRRPLEFLSGLSRWAALGWLLSHGIARRHVTGQCLIDRR